MAPSEATVLVEGESGTGKELIAEALHQFGPRRNKPMVVFDCSAVPRELWKASSLGMCVAPLLAQLGTGLGRWKRQMEARSFLMKLGTAA